MSGLDVELEVDERDVALAFGLAPGETVALLGPNGAGKSTVLNVVAGLLRADRGHVRLRGRVLADERTWVPSHDRGVALLAQDPLLFPHLSVSQNVAFGPRSAGRPRRDARDDALRWLGEVDAEALADRRPGELSGGQAQRVAVARALAAEPAVLLLDEPMAALDVNVAPQLRLVLRRVLESRTTVLVTHDPLDALLLADRVIVIDGGRIVESGPSRQVLARPRSAFAARIAGLDLVEGVVDGHGVRTADGVSVQGVMEDAVPKGNHAVAVFSPSAVAVHRDVPGGSPRNHLTVTITELEPRGELVRVRADELSADITTTSAADLALVPGDEVTFVVKASEVAIYPR